jgi:hypothetical protein
VRKTKIEGVFEQRAEKYVWTSGGGSGRRLEKTA